MFFETSRFVYLFNDFYEIQVSQYVLSLSFGTGYQHYRDEHAEASCSTYFSKHIVSSGLWEEDWIRWGYRYRRPTFRNG